MTTAGYSWLARFRSKGPSRGRGHRGGRRDFAIERIFNGTWKRRSSCWRWRSLQQVQSDLWARLTGSSTSPTGGGINELCPLLESLVRPVRRPEGYEERDALVSAARNLVQAFRERSRELTGVREDAPEMLAPDIRDLNGYLSEMAALNDKIVEADITGGTASDLRDKRSALLKTISGLIELDYYEASDGSLSGFLSAGHSLVQGGTFHALDVAVNPSNGNYYDFVLRVRSRGKRRQRPDQSGEIAGLSALGTIHPRVSERPGRTRRNLVSAVNSRHGQGFDLKGIRGKLFRRRSERGPWK